VPKRRWNRYGIGGLRDERGKRGEAGRLYREAANHGDTTAIAAWTRLAEERGDRGLAFTLALAAANHGDSMAMSVLAECDRKPAKPRRSER
jgi:hypothetical protein